MSLNTVPTDYHEFEYSKLSVFKLKFMTTGRIHAERWTRRRQPTPDSVTRHTRITVGVTDERVKTEIVKHRSLPSSLL